MYLIWAHNLQYDSILTFNTFKYNFKYEIIFQRVSFDLDITRLVAIYNHKFHLGFPSVSPRGESSHNSKPAHFLYIARILDFAIFPRQFKV